MITVNLTGEDAEPSVTILNNEKVGGRFAILHLGAGTTIILPGVDAGTVNYLRSLAVAIDKEANELEDAIVGEALGAA